MARQAVPDVPVETRPAHASAGATLSAWIHSSTSRTSAPSPRIGASRWPSFRPLLHGPVRPVCCLPPAIGVSRMSIQAKTPARMATVTTIPLSEAKDKLSALVEAAETTHEIVTITRHGREAAVLMAKSDLDSLHETIFWLSQPGARDDVARARRESADGQTTSGAELRAEYGLGE